MTQLPVFFLASLALLLTPGPAVIYILTNSIDRGWRAGLLSVIGIETGNFVHVITVTLGITALMKASEQALLIIKLIGSAYLVFLGIQSLVRRRKDLMTSEVSNGNRWGLITRGILVAIFNPKTALFFLAFLPQFQLPGSLSIGWQIFLLGCMFVTMAIITDSLYSILASVVRDWFKKNTIFSIYQKYFVGIIYIALGIAAAFSATGTT